METNRQSLTCRPPSARGKLPRTVEGLPQTRGCSLSRSRRHDIFTSCAYKTFHLLLASGTAAPTCRGSPGSPPQAARRSSRPSPPPRVPPSDRPQAGRPGLCALLQPPSPPPPGLTVRLVPASPEPGQGPGVRAGRGGAAEGAGGGPRPGQPGGRARSRALRESEPRTRTHQRAPEEEGHRGSRWRASHSAPEPVALAADCHRRPCCCRRRSPVGFPASCGGAAATPARVRGAAGAPGIGGPASGPQLPFAAGGGRAGGRARQGPEVASASARGNAGREKPA
jgi:hypothetical protein